MDLGLRVDVSTAANPFGVRRNNLKSISIRAYFSSIRVASKTTEKMRMRKKSKRERRHRNDEHIIGNTSSINAYAQFRQYLHN